MATETAISGFELHEMRLRVSADRALAESIVANHLGPDGPSVLVLSSIADDRDVAVVRAIHHGDHSGADTKLLATLASQSVSRRPIRRYQSRLAVRSRARASYFRLAVTERGINDPTDRAARTPGGEIQDKAAAEPAELLWIGEPVDAHAGLLVVVGHTDEGRFAPDAHQTNWPLPLSADLGVRIYAGGSA